MERKRRSSTFDSIPSPGARPSWQQKMAVWKTKAARPVIKSSQLESVAHQAHTCNVGTVMAGYDGGLVCDSSQRWLTPQIGPFEAVACGYCRPQRRSNAWKPYAWIFRLGPDVPDRSRSYSYGLLIGEASRANIECLKLGVVGTSAVGFACVFCLLLHKLLQRGHSGLGQY